MLREQSRQSYMAAPLALAVFALLVLGAFVSAGVVGCAGARPATPKPGSRLDSGATPQFDSRGISFGDGSGGGGGRLDGPTQPSPDAPPLVADVDKDGHCAQGQIDPTGSTCKTYNDCDDNDPTRHPDAVETCANVGIDNDCDNDKDEVDIDKDGQNDLGAPCQTTLPGACATGTGRCDSGGTFVCEPDVKVGQTQETCNGIDDDCDGKVDDGSGLCASGETCGGKSGCRCGSGPACTGGATCDGTSCVTCDTTNLAPSATPTSSGGGETSTGYGPGRMNDGHGQSVCSTYRFHWIRAQNGYGGGKWIQLTWPKAVRIGRISFDTVTTAGGCGASAGRTLAGGLLQYRDGTTWKDIVQITGRTGDWSRSFTPVTTTSLRLYNAHAHTSGNANPVIIEWRAYCK